MRFIFGITLFLVVFFTFAALGQDPTSPFTEPTLDELGKFVDGVRGVQGFSWFVLALIACQALFLIFRTIWGEILGVHRLLVLAVLSVGATIGANILSGKTVIESVLLDASTLMAYQVLFHQLKRQWEKREEDRKNLLALRDDAVRTGLHDEGEPKA